MPWIDRRSLFVMLESVRLRQDQDFSHRRHTYPLHLSVGLPHLTRREDDPQRPIDSWVRRLTETDRSSHGRGDSANALTLDNPSSTWRQLTVWRYGQSAIKLISPGHAV
ncbi:hypothetical protein BJX63DRAFT_309811 [Aspergillus granulosus]|uniref:Uncharacterized protein n=1 Tax=Aspergillus granulosus TaxID=176169 RepID=A0ABR4H722_9EURO